MAAVAKFYSLDKMRSLMRVLIAAVVFCWVYAAFAPTPSRSYVEGLGRGAEIDLSPTNAEGEVLLSAVTNSAGGISITRELPPEHDWRFRIGSTWQGLTYYGTTAPVGSRGTWAMAFGHSLRLHMHPFSIVAALGVLAVISIVLTWKVTRKGTSDRV